MAAAPPKPADEPKLLWNPENVKDVAESVGISSLNEEALKCLAQDVEYRLGQVIIESLRFMRYAGRTTLTVQDVSQAMKVLDVEPLYGYESTRPLRYGEASLGPGQPLFYIEDEEVDFEKLINAPLPKVPRDATFTGRAPPPSPAVVHSTPCKTLTTDLFSTSALARHRRRPADHPPKPDHRRSPLPRTRSQGSWRKPCPGSPRRQRQRVVQTARETCHIEGACHVLREDPVGRPRRQPGR